MIGSFSALYFDDGGSTESVSYCNLLTTDSVGWCLCRLLVAFPASLAQTPGNLGAHAYLCCVNCSTGAMVSFIIFKKFLIS